LFYFFSEYINEFIFEYILVLFVFIGGSGNIIEGLHFYDANHDSSQIIADCILGPLILFAVRTPIFHQHFANQT